MKFPLLRKEAREHGAVLATTFAVAALALYLMLSVAAEVGGRFIGLANFLSTIGVVLALVLANRLLVREYTGRTQLFLETLPVGRARAFATKWLLGCGLMLLTAWLAWLATLGYIRRTEVLDSSDALGALACAAAFCFTAWSFAALAGMLGRYRYIAWAAVVSLTLLSMDVAGIPFFDLPVMRLLGQDVQMAYGFPETSAFVYALGLAAVCAAGAATLALAGSGAMASALARRMTARERVFALVALLAVATIGYSLEPKPVQPPFEITDGERYQGKWTRVGVLPTASFDAAAARRLAGLIGADADTLIDALELDIHPPVYVLPQQGLDRHVMQRAALREADGIVLKVAPNAPDDFVRTLVLHSLLTDATLDRGMKEDRHVLLDGFAVYWALRDEPEARAQWWLRVAAIPEPLPPDHLTAWAETSERFGECQSLALAYSVVDTLVQRLGLETSLGAMRQIFKAPRDDVLVLFERRPTAALAAAGVDWAWLATTAAAARQSERERRAAALARRPAVTADVAVRSGAGQGVAIETSLSGAPRYAAYYQVLYPWTADVGEMSRLDVLGGSAVLPLSAPRNARVLTVIEVEDEVLDCPVRVLAERVQLQ